ncbi:MULTISPECIES: GNAT family N-acetyltransferase [unclassified Yoonia]|uniref:GNAT family N-acetyltransferase n=1 Tax=unclassified Yoonia TaxID=2629118 RepID=UPI002B0002E3|nr:MULTISPECIES: GNAT family N-acetyltransferase [unclassified Yoonia]
MTVPILQTARLTLRPLAASDSTAITDTLRNWDVTRWLSQVPFPYTLADADSFIEMVQHSPDDAHWAIDQGAGLIGLISVKPDLGYWLAQAYHRQGVMTEAARAVLTWYFTDQTAPVLSGYFAGNAASRAILTKLGFTDTHIETIMPVNADAPVALQRMELTWATWNQTNG